MNRHDHPKDWPIKNEYLLELGRLMSLWGTLESAINIAIGKLMGFNNLFDARPAIVLAHATFQQRCDAFETLCEQLAPEHPHLRTYGEVLKKIRSAQQGRNKYAHNSITFNPETQNHEVFRLTAKGALKVSSEVVRPNDIREVTAKTHEATLMLHNLVTGSNHRPLWEG